MRKFEFSAPMSVTANLPDGRRFSGTLYSGGLITDHPSWAAVAFDLQTLRVATPMPLLLSHRPDQAVGVVRRVQIGVDLRVEGTLFTGIDDKAKEVARKADAGLIWQMSVGIYLGRVEQFPHGRSVAVNGRVMTGPLTVLRNAIVREASVVPVGADRETSMVVFGARKAVATFSAPRGYRVLPEDQRRLEAVLTLSERHGLDFETAVRILERQQWKDCQ